MSPRAAPEPPVAGAWAPTALRTLPWREPLEVLSAFADEPFALALLSDGRGWSYVLREPEAALTVGPDDPRAALEALPGLLGPAAAADSEGPPFQGGAAGLLGYELGGRIEPASGAGGGEWPVVACGVYARVLAFDHDRRRIVAVGRGRDPAEAAAHADAAAGWASAAAQAPAEGRLAEVFAAVGGAGAYEAAVAAVVARIRAGELFQANIARGWGCRLAAGARPFDLLARLAAESPAPFCGYLRLEDRALVSNSPERFVRVDSGGVVETRPIKGTRARGGSAEEDARLAAELASSAKDRAENLMIVDLMRNDLARVCAPGSVTAPELFAVESYANVHHLVSTVRGTLAPGAGAVDVLGATFPPGSVTGAPKVQAMRVIAAREPPRGPYCGALFWAGFDGRMDSSVLIRTAACVERDGGWDVEARAGAGITADSDPAAESAEAEAKIGAIRAALVG
ncbi:MAG TPA: anthranilate synthase component I family protein [Caulobacteraceae bacterium]